MGSKSTELGNRNRQKVCSRDHETVDGIVKLLPLELQFDVVFKCCSMVWHALEKVVVYLLLIQI